MKLKLFIGALLMLSLCSFVFKTVSYKQKVAYFESVITYTPYEVLMIYTKAHEGYREDWYPDGRVKGRKSYSIGYGINDQGNCNHAQSIKQKYTKDGRTNKVLASKAIGDFFTQHKGDIQTNNIFYETVWLLHRYNRGVPKGGKIDRCCGSKSPGCGSSNKNIRKSHSSRRLFEAALLRMGNKNNPTYYEDLYYIKIELQKAEAKIKKQ